jgi:hypothetical protein
MRSTPLILAAVSSLALIVSGCASSGTQLCCGAQSAQGAPAEKWIALFNGQDLTGWKAEGNARWEVRDGLLIGTQGEQNAPGDLFTERSFANFELVCTYRAEWPCNSGIWFRYQNPGKAYQADILEWKDPVAYSGTIYCPGKMFLAINDDKSIENRDGWNTLRVRAEGDHLQVWLNDRLTGDVRDSTTDAGRIGFQVHPGAEFGPMKIVVREIRVRVLD